MNGPAGGKTRTATGVDRRKAMIGGTAIAAGLALMPRKSFGAEMGPVVQTRDGKLRGMTAGPVKVFKGVAYGAPTGGQNRFMPPKPVTPWSGVRNATQYGEQSPQVQSVDLLAEVAALSDTTPQGEDCLRLNVWTPGLDNKKRPVMVWLHGGGYSQGSGGWILYDGTNLAKNRDVVVVTVNHRLNAFGFLYLAELGGEKYADSGNVGMLDIVAALKWVRDNIAEFGGDPDSVTVFGQSGGGGKTTTLMAMPPAKGLFHKTIPESGLALRSNTTAHATETAEKLMHSLGLKRNQVDELYKIPFQVLTMAASKFGFGWGPVVDHRSLLSNPFDPVAPEMSANVPMLLGSVLTESTFFANTPLYPIDDKTLLDLVKKNTRSDDAEAKKLIALYRKDYPKAENTRIYQYISSDNWMTANVALVASRKAALKAAPAYVYHFEKLTPVRDGLIVCPHTLEIAYVFDNVGIPRVALYVGTEQSRFALADKMSTAWTTFARTGNPNTTGLPSNVTGPGLPHWRPYSASDRAVMILNDKCELVVDPHAAERKAIDAIHKRNGLPAPA